MISCNMRPPRFLPSTFEPEEEDNDSVCRDRCAAAGTDIITTTMHASTAFILPIMTSLNTNTNSVGLFLWSKRRGP